MRVPAGQPLRGAESGGPGTVIPVPSESGRSASGRADARDPCRAGRHPVGAPGRDRSRRQGARWLLAAGCGSGAGSDGDLDLSSGTVWQALSPPVASAAGGELGGRAGSFTLALGRDERGDADAAGRPFASLVVRPRHGSFRIMRQSRDSAAPTNPRRLHVALPQAGGANANRPAPAFERVTQRRRSVARRSAGGNG